MSLARRLASHATAALTGDGIRDFRRNVAEVRRRLRSEPHRITYFHQVDDPYSHLSAQVLASILSRYDVELEPHVVGPDDVAPQPEMLAAYARKDAADIAPACGLEFPRDVEAAEPDLVRRGARLLVDVPTEDFVARASLVGAALWSRDRGAMEKLAQDRPGVDEERVRAALAEGAALRRRLGHYSGAMFHYGGEWYWGVDRLGHLERRLRDMGLARESGDGGPIVVRPAPGHVAGDKPESPPTLEYFPSLRSPYTYISMERVYDLPRRYGIELRLRPVLPMVMRGMSVPTAKRMYIALDTKREADIEGIPFGRICDPVGKPVERGFSLYGFAREKGRAAEYLLSFARGVFADGIDAGTEKGLRRIAERAGLVWDDAQTSRSDESWRAELEANREAMFAAGLWGVPSFRLLEGGGHPEFATWGQDRIWLVEQEIRRRLGAT